MKPGEILKVMENGSIREYMDIEKISRIINVNGINTTVFIDGRDICFNVPIDKFMDAMSKPSHTLYLNM